MATRFCSRHSIWFPSIVAFFISLQALSAQTPATLHGRIIDADTRQLIPARLYLESDSGEFHLAQSVGGAAVPYEKRRREVEEVHTSLSAHPFEASLPPGTYHLTVERGKEYLPNTQTITLEEGETSITIPLKRWINMNDAGWFSGETHVHRPLSELRTLMLCEELNVALPLTAWVRGAEDSPLKNNLNPELVLNRDLIEVDPTHVIWPLNTEYEITEVAGERHPLGALFILNHKKPLDLSAPPVGPVVKEARKQGAILDLDKHNWPWSMMLVPTAGVNLFQLTNNHLWRADFVFSSFFPDYVPEYMDVEHEDGLITERGWIDYGFQTYYALLNCGFDIMPSAGTASGVHPVPFGFGRVYVKLDGEFDYDSWIDGLKKGYSFVTTSPMLNVTYNGQGPGKRISGSDGKAVKVRIQGWVRSPDPIDSVEIIQNGDVVHTLPGVGTAEAGVYSQEIDLWIEVTDSSWLAVRSFAQWKNNRPRFAHSAPVFVDLPGKSLRPRTVEVEYLLKRAEEEITRHTGVLSKDAVDEFRAAAETYRELLEIAR
tara:strand:+ start:1478 stop:3109 length:1632 start_codon:yes stop_codon:yes gene_type:complete